MKEKTLTRTLLLIDDSTMLGKRVFELIQDIPYLQVSGQATTIKQGYEMIEKHHPDIVLLDLSLPDGNGFEILRHIKATQPFTKVIILSNSSDELHKKESYQLKADMFLDKTRDFSLLVGVMEEMLMGQTG